ncbi:hypothetical protein E3N88_24265 [Mikania micrantha]|uniref:MULE transposase domain-containing protein n=1 Tax=Mikania micrantha TaxID=192012 RepID=A0A5N6NFT3_9ASTR|nr:hypothetical protein E3N88_24265 [Mikania micrantha]
MCWWDGDFFFGQFSDVSRVAETYQDGTGVYSSEATTRPVLPDLNEEVAGQTSYWRFDLNQEPCVDDDVNRECYVGEQSHPPQVAVKEEEADVIFISVEELMAWVKSRAIDNGFVVVTGQSKKKGTDEVNKIWLVCGRGGEHNSTTILRRTGSKKIGCPFKLIWIYDSDSYGWKLQVINDKHNHKPAQNIERHPFVKRLFEKEQNMVHHLTEQHIEPRNILSSIKKQNPDNVSIRRDIYSIVGVTSIHHTFCIAHAFVSKEKEENYHWVIERVKEMLDKCMEPRVIITDRDLALMNACRKVFPHASSYLCRWNISENIAKHCKASFSDGDWKTFKGRWGNLCDSSFPEIYDYNCNRLYEQLVVDNRQSKCH